MGISLLTEEASKASPATGDRVKVIIDNSGDAPQMVMIDRDGNQTAVGSGDGEGGSLPDSPEPHNEMDITYVLRNFVPWEGAGEAGGPYWDANDLPAALPAFGSQSGDFSSENVGRLLQIQPYGDIAYAAFWTDLQLPILNRRSSESENGTFGPYEDPPSGSVLGFIEDKGEGYPARIDWVAGVPPLPGEDDLYDEAGQGSRDLALFAHVGGPGEEGGPTAIKWGVRFDLNYSNIYELPESTAIGGHGHNVLFSVPLNRPGWGDSGKTLRSMLFDLQLAAFDSYELYDGARVNPVLTACDLVTSIDSVDDKFVPATTVVGRDAVGVVIGIEGLGGAEADRRMAIFSGRALVEVSFDGSSNVSAGDHMYVSGTHPGKVRVGPPASGTKQYIGRAEDFNGDYATKIRLRLNIQPQQPV